MIITPTHPSAEATHAAVTMDNGANIIAAAKKLNRLWLNCFGDSVHLEISTSICVWSRSPSNEPVLHRRECALSWVAEEEPYKEAQTELRIPQHGLIIVCYKSYSNGLTAIILHIVVLSTI